MARQSNAPLLEIAAFHLSPTKASDLVIRLLKAADIKRPAGDWASHTYTLHTPKGDIPLNFRDMVQEARLSGGVRILQNWLDSGHPIFGGTFGMAVSSPHMTIGTKFAGYEKELRGPARNYPVEQELVDDILEFRKLVCHVSSPPHFAETVRFYRSYLFCCVTLIDAFVNRFIHIAKFKKQTGPQFERLCESRNAEERIELWTAVFTQQSFSALNGGIQWDHFKKLREERNHQTHAVEPFYGYRIAQLPTILNYCREGIGGLLLRMLELGGYGSHALLERLRTAPTVRYVGPE